MTDFFHTLKDKATGKLYPVLDVNAAKKDLSNIGTVNVSIFTNDAGYLTAIPNTYKTKTENDALYQAKGNYLTAIPNTVALKANYYTKSELYTASEIDTKIAGYEVKGTAYSKADSDGKYALKTAIANFKTPNNTSIDDLSDVTVSSVKNGQSLVWQNNKWVNNDVAGGSNLVTINAEWSDTAGDAIPASIAGLKAGALIRFNGNILEILKDGTRLVKAPDLAPNDYSMIAPAKHDQWSGSYTKYIRGEIVYHKDAWWQCRQVVNVGDEPGTSLGANKWEKWEGIGNHEDYLRLDGDKVFSNSGHQVAAYGKNVVSYDSGKLYQGDGTQIGIATTSDLGKKEDKVPNNTYNVYRDGSFDLKDTNGGTLTGNTAGAIARTDKDFRIKAFRAVFDGKKPIVKNGNNYLFYKLDSSDNLDDEIAASKDSLVSFDNSDKTKLYGPDGTELDFTTNAKVDDKIKNASSKVAITFDEANEEIKVKFS